MMIFTGSHSENFPDGFKRISISRGNPKNRVVDEFCMELAPAWNMLKLPNDEYYEKYELIYVKAKKKVSELVERGRAENIVLLCWERNPAECHRSYVAKRIREEYSAEVYEFKYWSIEGKMRARDEKALEEKKKGNLEFDFAYCGVV
jgi:hypothetical protein